MPKINNLSKQKKSFFKKRFDLTNKKVRFFVVIGIFVILGGGYFTYRSFAYDRLPLHFANTFFYFDDKPMPYGAEELEYVLKPIINDHADGVYMTNQFWFKGSSDSKNPDLAPGYAGLQTSKCSYIGRKCVVFSIWRAISGTASIPGSTSRNFTHEGSGWQIIAPYDWSANESYVIKVRFVGTNGAGEDQWRASIRNVKSARVTEIGTIRVNGSWWGLDTQVATFSEVFQSGSSNRSCLNIPYIGVEYNGYFLRAGNTTLRPFRQGIRYDGPGRETANCRNQSQITPLPGGVRHEMSGFIRNNDTRSYDQNVK